MVFWAIVYSIAISLHFDSVQASMYSYIAIMYCMIDTTYVLSRIMFLDRARVAWLLRPVQRRDLQEVSCWYREGMVQRLQ